MKGSFPYTLGELEVAMIALAAILTVFEVKVVVDDE
jgi:hypothetical protein